MLQAMRDGSKGLVAKIIVGLIILTFALFGIDSIVALGGGQDAPAEVNGEEISELKVGQMVQMQKRRMQSQFGENFNMEDSRLRLIALDGLINESVLKQAAKSGGIHFSDQEIDKIILLSPEFQVNGAFDRNQFDLALRSAGFTRTSYRELLRTNLLIQQAQNGFQASAFSTVKEETSVAELDAQSRDYSTITYSFNSVKEGIEVSTEELDAYYQENSSRFMTEESVIVDYLELKRSELSVGSFVDEDQIAARYDELLMEAASKKEYRAAHILLLEANEESRASLADISNRISKGEDFAVLAKEFSEDDSSKFSGGDLGFSALEVFEDEFSQALSELSVGGLSSVVQTRDGLHLIKLLEERQPEIGSLASLKDSIESDLKEEASEAAYVEALETLKDEAFSSNGIAEAGKAQDLTVKTSKEFTRLSKSGLASYSSVVESAFSDAVLNEDSNSEVIEVADGHAIVIHLNSFNESKVKSFDSVKSQIVAVLENSKARDELALKAQESLKQAREGSLVSGWSSVFDKRRATQGVEASIIKAVFALPEGQEASYELVSVAGGDQVLVRLDKVTRSEIAVTDKSADQKVSRSKAYNEYRAYQQLATDKAEIERN